MNLLVIGSGVIGLTTAVRLQEAGFAVRIITDAFPAQTTSAVAAAIWYPYKAYPQDRVFAWGKRALEVFYELADDAGTGVSITTLIEGFDHKAQDPWWRDAVRHYRRAAPDELQTGYTDGYVVEVPMIEAPVYLDYLLNRFVRGGGEVEIVPDKIADLDEVQQANQTIINCTGLGARALVSDDAVYPIRGQVVRVENPGVNGAFVDDHGPNAVSYIFPRSDDCILGGTAEAHSWNLDEDLATTERILNTARRLKPALRDAAVLGVQVGLRPARETVRLECEQQGETTIIHNYGHGGAGFTLSWGCAEDVLELVEAGL